MPPFRLTDDQLRAVMQAAAPLDPVKRSLLLTRIGGRLRLTGNPRPTDHDVADAVEAGLRGLKHDAA